MFRKRAIQTISTRHQPKNLFERKQEIENTIIKTNTFNSTINNNIIKEEIPQSQQSQLQQFNQFNSQIQLQNSFQPQIQFQNSLQYLQPQIQSQSLQLQNPFQSLQLQSQPQLQSPIKSQFQFQPLQSQINFTQSLQSPIQTPLQSLQSLQKPLQIYPSIDDNIIKEEEEKIKQAQEKIKQIKQIQQEKQRKKQQQQEKENEKEKRLLRIKKSKEEFEKQILLLKKEFEKRIEEIIKIEEPNPIKNENITEEEIKKEITIEFKENTNYKKEEISKEIEKEININKQIIIILEDQNGIKLQSKSGNYKDIGMDNDYIIKLPNIEIKYNGNCELYYENTNSKEKCTLKSLTFKEE